MYLSVNDNSFGFKHPNINIILEKDIEISDEIYDKFFELQNKGKQFRIKNKYGNNFEEIFEEVVTEVVIQRSSIEERMILMEKALNEMVLGG